MSASGKPRVLFVPGHMCDERLYAAQLAALGPDFDCQVMVFRREHSLDEIAKTILAAQPTHFHYVGLSMGGYIAFELLRQQPQRLLSLALFDTKTAADQPQQRDARLADRELVRTNGLEQLAAQLPDRWLAPKHSADAALCELVKSMALNIGGAGLIAQQDAMLSRPDSLPDLADITCPSLVVVGRQDQVTPIADHQAIIERIRGHRADCRFEVVEDCGHLSTIEQPEVTSRLLCAWLKQ